MVGIKRFIYESSLKDILSNFKCNIDWDQKECNVLKEDDPVAIEIKTLIQKLNSTNKISLDKVTEVLLNDGSVWYEARIYGGLNGNGNWVDYLIDIENIFKKLKDSWLINIDNDAPDDIWVLRLGFRK
jgi:hypothetical protein